MVLSKCVVFHHIQSNVKCFQARCILFFVLAFSANMLQAKGSKIVIIQLRVRDIVSSKETTNQREKTCKKVVMVGIGIARHKKRMFYVQEAKTHYQQKELNLQNARKFINIYESSALVDFFINKKTIILCIIFVCESKSQTLS